jgi:hypothetical protein
MLQEGLIGLDPIPTQLTAGSNFGQHLAAFPGWMETQASAQVEMADSDRSHWL